MVRILLWHTEEQENGYRLIKNGTTPSRTTTTPSTATASQTTTTKTTATTTAQCSKIIFIGRKA